MLIVENAEASPNLLQSKNNIAQLVPMCLFTSEGISCDIFRQKHYHTVHQPFTATTFNSYPAVRSLPYQQFALLSPLAEQGIQRGVALVDGMNITPYIVIMFGHELWGRTTISGRRN